MGGQRDGSSGSEGIKSTDRVMVIVPDRRSDKLRSFIAVKETLFYPHYSIPVSFRNQSDVNNSVQPTPGTHTIGMIW